MTADLHVVRTAGNSRPFQLCPDLAVMGSRPDPQRQHLEDAPRNARSPSGSRRRAQPCSAPAARQHDTAIAETISGNISTRMTTFCLGKVFCGHEAHQHASRRGHCQRHVEHGSDHGRSNGRSGLRWRRRPGFCFSLLRRHSRSCWVGSCRPTDAPSASSSDRCRDNATERPRICLRQRVNRW
jgi:hypothetical protein